MTAARARPSPSPAATVTGRGTPGLPSTRMPAAATRAATACAVPASIVCTSSDRSSSRIPARLSLTRTLIATSALRDVDPPQRHLDAWLPAGQRGPPLAHLADHLVHLAADLHTVRRQHVGAGRPVASQADDHALAAGRRRLVARAGREPPPGR